MADLEGLADEILSEDNSGEEEEEFRDEADDISPEGEPFDYGLFNEEEDEDTEEDAEEGEAGSGEAEEEFRDEADDVKPEESHSSTDGADKKFEGKTREEVVQAYADLQAAYGRASNELGEARKERPQEAASEKPAEEPDIISVYYSDPEIREAAKPRAEREYQREIASERRKLERENYEGDELEQELDKYKKPISDAAWENNLTEQGERIHGLRAERMDRVPEAIGELSELVATEFSATGISADKISAALAVVERDAFIRADPATQKRMAISAMYMALGEERAREKMESKEPEVEAVKQPKVLSRGDGVAKATTTTKLDPQTKKMAEMWPHLTKAEIADLDKQVKARKGGK